MGPRKIPLAIAAAFLLGAGGYAVASQRQTDTEVPANTYQNTQAKETENKTIQPEVADYTLEPYRGTVYAMKKPGNWKVTDNLSAIETSDPSDPLTGVSGTVVVGAFGQQTPEGHIKQVLELIGASNVVVEHSSDTERVKERWTGLTWVIRTQTFTFTDASGNRVKAKASAGVLQGSGQYVAMISAFQTTPEKWNKWAPALERMMQTIQIIDGKRVGGYDKVRLPSAADLKSDSSPLMDSWEYRNRSGDRSSQGYSDATLGQESGLTSSSSGNSYTLPLSDYDPGAGGYHNPDNPSEILQDKY